MFPCGFDEKQHEIFSGELVRWCKRNAPADWKNRLFTYHHKLHDTLVIAVWASGRKLGVFSDVINMGGELRNFDRKKADILMQRMWAPVSPETMSRQINQQARDFDSMQQDKNAEIKDENVRRRKVWAK